MTINPADDFVANFYQNPGAAACYASNLTTEQSANEGDLNAVYSHALYTVAPGYELVVLGYFPNSRFMSATLYDNHLTTSPGNYLFDYQFPPLFSGMTNPFLPGTPFTHKQMYGFTVSFGGSVAGVSPGCGTTSTFGQTVFDATQIHPGYTWNDAIYPPPPAPFPVHLSGANSGGVVQIRDYLDYGYEHTQTLPTPAVVIVRDLSTGCAIPASQATTKNNPTGQPIINVNGSVNFQNAELPWLDQDQITAHDEYYVTAAITPTETYPSDTFAGQQAQWVRSSDWVRRTDTAAAYLSTFLPLPEMTSFLNGESFMRIRFRLPTNLPTIPCNPTNDTCSLTGTEAMRYFSLEFKASTPYTYTPPDTFTGGTGSVLAALDDTAFVRSSQGQVTLIVGLAATPPPGVTSANGYTYFNLAPFLTSGAPGFNSLLIRNLLASPSFPCSVFNVPTYTMEYNNVGGFMGAYVPTVDFPSDETVFGPAHSPGRPNTCTGIPAAATPNYNFPRTPA
jgi:hypothetical protein